MTSNDTPKRSDRIRELFSNTEYIDWLWDFLRRRSGCFSMSEWRGNSLQIPEQDKESIKNMYLFFQGISIYAKKHNIKFVKGSDEIFYMVKYCGLYFKLGFKYLNKYDDLFCKEIDFDEEYAYIDFGDILDMYSKTIGGKKKR